MSWENLIAWVYKLGENYNVDPVIFGSIYIGAIPLFTISIGWLVKNIRHKKSIILPAIFLGITKKT